VGANTIEIAVTISLLGWTIPEAKAIIAART
jgi:hypothetical protein